MMGQDDSQRELSREVVTSTLDELTKLPEALMIERAYLEHQPAESPVVVSASRRRNPSESNPTQAQALMELARRKRSEALIESYDRRLDAAFEACQLMRAQKPLSSASAVCRLHYLEGLNWKEVGSRLGISNSSVFRARNEAIAWLMDHPELVRRMSAETGDGQELSAS